MLKRVAEGRPDALTETDVIAGYRLILGREPENQDVIRVHLGARDIQHLRSNLLRSDEFRGQLTSLAGVIPVGLHMSVDRVEVEVSATPEQLSEMLHRTAHTWQSLGAAEPHWSVLTADDFKSASIARTKADFYKSGHHHIALIGAMLRRNGLDFPRRGVCLDFGCGVGRLSLALAAHCGTVIGVDVSAAHIRHAIERQNEEQITNASFQTIGTVDDLSLLPRFDMLVSLIVLQHNPPPVMGVILDRLLSLLTPSGIACFQVPTFIAGYSFIVDRYLSAPISSQMEMHALPQPYVYDLLSRHSCRLVEVREDLFTGSSAMVSQTFLVQKRAE